jgi:hypothetical protein
MTEADYWLSLEYRICREFEGMANFTLRHYWCDGLTPRRYHLRDSEPRITGHAWICYGEPQEQWEFTLFLPHPVDSRDQIDWVSLLPAENRTRWIAFDPHRKNIQFEPSAAVPDLA